jgi:hypothetical protein
MLRIRGNFKAQGCEIIERCEETRPTQSSGREIK